MVCLGNYLLLAQVALSSASTYTISGVEYSIDLSPHVVWGPWSEWNGWYTSIGYKPDINEGFNVSGPLYWWDIENPATFNFCDPTSWVGFGNTTVGKIGVGFSWYALCWYAIGCDLETGGMGPYIDAGFTGIVTFFATYSKAATWPSTVCDTDWPDRLINRFPNVPFLSANGYEVVSPTGMFFADHATLTFDINPCKGEIVHRVSHGYLTLLISR